MTASQFPNGLIASLGTPTAAPLYALAARTEWPMLLDATVAQLCRAIDQQRFHGVWFWLEQRAHIAATAKLVAWLGQGHPGIYRFVLAHEQPHEAEQTVRAAGVHAYLPVSGDIVAIVEEALWPLRHRASRSVSAPTTSSAVAMEPSGAAAEPRPP